MSVFEMNIKTYKEEKKSAKIRKISIICVQKLHSLSKISKKLKQNENIFIDLLIF